MRFILLILILIYSAVPGFSLSEISIDDLLKQDSIEARYKLAMVYLLQENYNAAFDIFNHIYKISSQNSVYKDNSLFWIGIVYRNQNNNSKSFEILNNYLKISQFNHFRINSLINLGDLYLAENSYQKAINKYHKALLTFEDNNLYPYIYYKLGESYLKLNNFHSAYESFNIIILNYPNSTEFQEAIKRNNFIQNRLEIEEAPVNAPTSIEKYIIQLGAFRTKRSADNFVRNIKNKNVAAYSVYEDNLHKVRVGFFNTHNEAINYFETNLKPHNYNGFILTIK